MNDEELDEIRRLLFKKTTNDWYYHVNTQGVPQASIHREAVESMLTRILDWHNKQTLELLDRLWHHSEVMNSDVNPIYGVPLSAIEAEREKLNSPDGDVK